MQLTSNNIRTTIMAALFEAHEVSDHNNPPAHVPAHGVMLRVGFHPERLEAQRDNVKAMLAQLPEDFMHDKGGGASFLTMVTDNAGKVYGEQRDADALLTMAVALNLASFPLPRDVWKGLPGGVPYVVITL